MAIRTTQYQNIGKMNKLVTVQAYSNLSDGMGGFTTTYTDDGTIFCDIIPLSGSQRLQYGDLSTDISHRITARYNANLNTEKRLSFQSRNFTLKVVLNLGEDNTFMEFLASEEES